MLRIDKELFQWEKGRYVIVSDKNSKITSVQFYNNKSKVALEVKVEDGKAKIPNPLLEECLPLTAIACEGDDENSKVIARKTFKVLARCKPESYIDEDPTDPDEPVLPDHIIFDGGMEV